MKEELREFYRIDPLKVKRKIYESYPPNSKQRADMVKEEKLKELSHLHDIAHGFNGQVSELAMESLRVKTLGLLAKAVISSSFAVVFLSFPTQFSLSPFEHFLSLSISISLLIYAAKSFFTIGKNIGIIKEYKDALETIESKMKKLKKDIFDDPR